jgi:hypothetical protein
MWKTLRPYRIGLVLSAIYLGLCIFISGLPSPTHQCDYQKAEHCAPHDQKTISTVLQSGVSWIDSNEWIAFGTLVIAAFTVVLACIAYNQQAATRVLERAYLSVQPLGIRQGEDGGWFATIGTHNAGRLPARDVWWSINIKRFSKHDHWQDFPLIEEKRRGPVITPGAVVRRASKRFSADDRYKTERFMHVWGEVAYSDGFGHGRNTKYCHRYNSAAIRPIGDGGLHVQPEDGRYHDYGNDAD